MILPIGFKEELLHVNVSFANRDSKSFRDPRKATMANHTRED